MNGYILADSLSNFPKNVFSTSNPHNQHAANENVRIGNVWSGIDMYGC